MLIPQAARYSSASQLRPTHARIHACASAACLLLAIIGCDVKTSDRDLVFLDPPMAMERMGARTGMFEKETVGCWVDPRSAAEYAKGHIKGAINVPLVEMQEAARPRLAGHNLFIVYGDGFQDPMAKAGAKRLIELGLKQSTIFVLEGGTRAWQRDGYALVTGNLPAGGEAAAKEAAPKSSGGVEVPEQGVR